MTMRFTLKDTVTIQKVVRRRMEELEPSTILPYEQAVQTIEIQRREGNAPAGHPAGHFINSRNELQRIPNSIAYEQGDGGGSKNKVVITNPLKVTTVEAVGCDEVEEEPIALPLAMNATEDIPDVDVPESEDSEEVTDEEAEETEDSNLESGGYAE
jgi:hypothetical protein